MQSAIVLGIGGTGKWVLTDLKRSIEDENGGEIPGNISLLAFDLIEDEIPKIERTVFDFKNGTAEPFTLDYNKEHGEFLNFSVEITKVFQDIINGKRNYPYIEKFLSKKEIKKHYPGKIDPEEAGQNRAIGRSHFFLHTDDIYERIYNAVKGISAQKKEKEPVLTFIVSSLAGGTGCGTFIDFTHFLHRAFEEEGTIEGSYYVIGIFLLPRGFESTIPNADSNVRFKVNCFSAFREMSRFIALPKHKTYYPGKLSDYSQKFHLFDMVFLIDGAKMPNTKHYEGLCPSISEFILANIQNKPLISLPNIITNGIKPNISDAAGKFDMAIYSTFGIHKYILEIEDIKTEFAHWLAKDILKHFIKEAPYPNPDSEVQDFMKGYNATQLMSGFLYQIVENPGTVGMDKNSLKRSLKFGSKEDDMDFREMKEDRIKIGGIMKRIPLPQVKRKAERLKESIIGSEKDFSEPRNQIRSTHGVLNYYIKKHYEKFNKILKEYLLNEILNSRNKNREGSLIHAREFLKALKETYQTIREKTLREFEDVHITDKINSCKRQINATKNTKKYRGLMVKLCGLEQHKLLMDSIEKIIDEEEKLIDKILEDVKIWISTFKDEIKKINDSQEQLKRARNAKRDIKSWSFVTEPEDKYENKIYELMRKEKPLNEAETKIQEKIPHIDFASLIDPKKYFIWVFDVPGKEKDSLSCTLPAEFAPFEERKNNAQKWNYNFINNYLKLGKLKNLNKLTIADILLLRGANAEEFARKLNEESSLLADYSDAKQIAGRNEKVRGTEKIKETLANFNPTSPGDDFAKQFKGELEKEVNSSTIQQDDSHSITQVKVANYIKYSGFTNLSSFEDIYRERGLKRPYHVFPEEKNALRIEEKFDEVLDEKPAFLNFKVVRLLREKQLIMNFAYALWKKWIKIKIESGIGKYVIETEEIGKKKEITLGKNRVESLEFLLFDDSRDAKKAREEIEGRVKKFEEGLKSKSDLENLIEDLKKFFNSVHCKEERDEAERDLLKVIKVLIYNEIKRFEDLKDKM